MEKFVMDINTVLNIIVLIVAFWIKKYINDQDKKFNEFQSKHDEAQIATTDYQKATTKEISQVKFNYLDRFETLNGKVHETKEQLTKSINDSEKNLTKLINEHLSNK